jgi:hypothetical protein
VDCDITHIRAVVFDVLGTVISTKALGELLLEPLGLPGAAYKPWLLRSHRDGLASTLMGDYRSMLGIVTDVLASMIVEYEVRVSRSSALGCRRF